GTSMAAPHAAGVAALMLAVEPALTPAEIEAQIKANAIPRNSTHCPRPCGAGLLNAAFPLPAAGPEPVIVPVFYTTDRRVTYSATPQEWYGSMRGPLSYGRVEVTIPLDHRLGHLEAPSFWRFEFREDPSKHVVFFSLEVLPEQKFYRELRSRVAASPQDDAFVFIHGYNVSFEDAARRTGQIAYDLNFQGAPILYSWPSRGELDDYPTDLNNAEWTVPHLQQFLSDLRERSGAQKIHLIAHSMGNKPLVSALAAMVGDPDAGDAAVFNQVLLTAPDIDADIFRTIAEQVVVAANRVTLYASQRDKALQIARQFHGLPRAGDASEGLVIVDGIDTIEASAVDTSLVGHSYYGDNRSVLSDIFAILKTQASPMERFGLRPAFYQGKRYWIFRP
ncbi:MAG TPA: alpha/beta fold hydrolase, partial [Alphaproteobacteria bacterium]|nr:alpha/beta fold hydrolase [Alphaproteobacteria bacterium]